MHKNFGEDRTCSSEDMIADTQTHTNTHTDRQTDRHTHHNTPLPYRGQSDEDAYLLQHKVNLFVNDNVWLNDTDRKQLVDLNCANKHTNLHAYKQQCT